MKILVVEDEVALLNSIKSFLKDEGYLCETATGFIQANEKVYLYVYDCILIDIGLPDGNGLNLINEIKKTQPTSGIIVLTAKNSMDDKISGLSLGADDYLAKPFHLAELNARIKALIRRRKFGAKNEILFNEVKIIPEECIAFVHEIQLLLTKKEFDMLLFFITNKDKMLKKEIIAEHLWGDNIDLADNFDFIYTHLSNLRKKMVEAGGEDYIKTIYGMGYKFTDEKPTP